MRKERPEPATLLAQLLDLSLEALSIVRQEMKPADKRWLQRLVDAMRAARGLADGAQDPARERVAEEARDTLRCAIEKRTKSAGGAGPAAAETRAATPAAKAAKAGKQKRADAQPAGMVEAGGADCEAMLHGLDEIASRLARSGPDDTARMREQAEALLALAAGACDPAVAGALQEAAILYRAIAAQEAEDPQTAYAEASVRIDRAAEVLRDRLTLAEIEAEKQRATPPAPLSLSTPPAPAAPRIELPLDEEKPAPATPAAPVAAVAPPASAAAIPLPADSDPTLLSDFVTECREYIAGAEAALLALEIDPEDSESVNTVFRAFHTIKGTSGFLAIDLVTELAHKAENLLSRMRDREIQCTGGYADLALRSIDCLKALIEEVAQAIHGEGLHKPPDYDELIRILLDPEAAGVSGDPSEATVLAPRLGDLQVGAQIVDREKVEATAATQGEVPIGLALARSRAASLADIGAALRAQKRIQRPAGAADPDSSVRVRTDRLDRLIDMVGELVIAHSMVAQDEGVAVGQRPELLRKVTHSGKIVRELQDLSMSMRMVPLKPTFQKMARLVRDLAHKSGREVDFVSSGEETEIDRNMVDVIADPLVHMIRNAVDHGIEFPDDREAAGKPRRGTVELAALHAGGNVVVQLRDDGRGLDRERIARKAIDRGLIETDKGMTDGEIYNLIFEPGFSTAEQVTEVSGRGVGMDVVRRAIVSLRGRIDIQSALGTGTTFTVKLPLTMAVTDGMLIRVGRQRFILPTVAIHMSFRPEPGSVYSVVGRGEMVMLRKELVPVVRLHRIFGIEGAEEDPTRALLVIVDDGDRRCGVMVDELLGQQQVVAKSLSAAMGKIQGLAGGAILGDGKVGLILDPAGVIRVARGGGTIDRTAVLEMMAAA